MKQPRPPKVPGIPAPDPAAAWVLGPGREDYLRPGNGPRTIPALLAFSDAALNGRGAARGGRDRIGDALRAARAAGDRFRTVMLPSGEVTGFLAEAIDPAQAARLDGIVLGAALPTRAAPGSNRLRPGIRPAPVPSIRPGTVVVGIIDDGLPFAHARFRRPDGTTRVESIWIQDGAYDGGASGYPYGRQIGAADIDALVAGHTRGGLVDEDAVYRDAGVMDFTQPRHKTIAARGSHGAHVMDGAAGFDPPDAPDWIIVAVQLPIASTEDTSGASLAGPVADAFRYIRDRAVAMGGGGGGPPVVVNFSYGFTAGPHDGSSAIELAIDDVVDGYEAMTGQAMRVVLPAGNSHLARAHSTAAFDAIGRTVELRFRTQPDDRTPSFVELWMPAGTPAGSRLELSLVSPGGAATLPLAEGSAAVRDLMIGGALAARVIYAPPTALSPSGHFLVSLQPTFRLETSTTLTPGADVSPHGLWTLRLRNLALAPAETVHAWIQRDDTPFGYPVRGRQAVFEDDDPRFDHAGREIETDVPTSVIRRAGAMNAIATGRTAIVAGALVDREMRQARYSAGGPLRSGPGRPVHRVGPDALVTADDSLAHDGTIASGTRSGATMILNGTSVAAPRLTRWIAGELAAGRAGDRAAVRAKAAAAEAALPPGTPPAPPPERGGHGRLRLPGGGPVIRSRRTDP